ncbi:MAG: universal stress protein [Nitrospiraceae bacterium]|nr:universal stress protein [Nitrospiraceae bacterium]
MSAILAAVDLGKDTESILAYTHWLSANWQTGNMDAHLLFVLDYSLTPPAYMMPYFEKERIKNKEALDKWAAALQLAGVNTSYDIQSGRLVETFASAIKERKASVMAVGYRTHMLKPSSSERLIRSLIVPTFIVRGKQALDKKIGDVKIKKILCAVDMSPDAKRSLDTARRLSRKSGAHLDILNVVDMKTIKECMSLWKGLDEQQVLCSTELAAEAHTALTSFAGTEDPLVVKTGIPHEVITQYAEESGADLIVMGARGVSRFEGLFLGSVSESVIKTSTCPVLVVN